MKQLAHRLQELLGRSAVLANPDELLVYECDGLPQHKHLPQAVVFPQTTEQVAAVVKLLHREGVPFVPRGAGTGLSGGAVALQDAVIIEFARMRRLLHLDVANRRARVQTGLVNAQLSQLVASHGLYYAPDPSSQVTCTIGGNIAENSGGIHCLKYGVTVDHILAARVVLSDGAIVELRADDEGYNLLGLFIGSEGTFGLATEATVNLLPVPEAVRTILADFRSIDDASRAVSAIIAAGLLPAGLEMIDNEAVRAVEASVFAAGMPLDAAGVLLIELDGLAAGLDEEVFLTEQVCRTHGARTVRAARDDAERKKFWAARKSAFGAMGRLAPDLMLQDAVVPRSRLPEILAETYRVGAEYGLRVANVFHAGDGNLHPLIPFDSRDADETERVKRASQAIMQACVAAGGTITGEHGVGFDKSAYMPLIFNDADMNAMLRVRAAFDPSGRCNPGKVIPVRRGCGEARAVAQGLSLPQLDATNANPAPVTSLVHAPADLVATVPADMTLRELNAALSTYGQWLPFDPPDDGTATLGEIVALGQAGPLALGYGTVAQMILGMRVTLADGTSIKTGGRVVKNVAGYDLAKLFTGSRNTLGNITEITFRLRPLPVTDTTLLAHGEAEKLLLLGREIARQNLSPVALELLTPTTAAALGVNRANSQTALAIRCTGNASQVAWQSAKISGIFASAGVGCETLANTSATQFWHDLAALFYVRDEKIAHVWHVSVKPSDAAKLWPSIASLQAIFPALQAHFGLGQGKVRISFTGNIVATNNTQKLLTLRDFIHSLDGTIATQSALSDTVTAPHPNAFLWQRLKQQLDPQNILK